MILLLGSDGIPSLLVRSAQLGSRPFTPITRRTTDAVAPHAGLVLRDIERLLEPGMGILVVESRVRPRKSALLSPSRLGQTPHLVWGGAKAGLDWSGKFQEGEPGSGSKVWQLWLFGHELR
jgi:hypothetical protein